MFLPLAERMVEKMVKEEKIEAEAEVWTVSLTLLGLNSGIQTENFSYFSFKKKTINSLFLFVPFHTKNVFTFYCFYFKAFILKR